MTSNFTLDRLSTNGFSLNSLAMMAASALLATCIFIAVPALVNAGVSDPAAKADLADAQDCELRNWPYYARSCLRDESRNAGRAVKARLVTTDRIGANAPVAAAAADRPSDEISANHRGSMPVDDRPGWMGMSQRDVAVYLSAGDFIRRTVR